ncbi:hydroxymethylbilane synthase [Rothia sp. ZJ1223]|uniref:hydroxymethylbilane synthase n=1 Tax=Rothia sp. ZJ1223 TaxID=2811098 RepID=UPI001957A9B9|nr:hydroxymethylbilane synthase [Rothia sp. ZJ1223]MBM7051079.1 hydroxymethylbilane synthase [Rothia sp. ZJ1223]
MTPKAVLVAKYLLGTRGSALAMAQSGMAGQRVAQAGGFEVELVTVKTEGDVLTGPLSQMGGTGVFAATLRTRVLDGTVDFAVHSLKDLPTAQAEGLSIAAIPEREDPRDALCARDNLTLSQLPEGARVGTGSPRRAAQLLAARPDLTIVDIRGNVGTRLARVAGLEKYGVNGHGIYGTKTMATATGDCDAVILAASGLKRLGLEKVITEYLDPLTFLPAPGQGALALETRSLEIAATESAEPSALAAALMALDHLETRMAVTAERALLRRLEAGCAAPVGTYARVEEGILVLDAVAAHPDGSTVLRQSASADELTVEVAELLGIRLADNLLENGAAELTGLTL